MMMMMKKGGKRTKKKKKKEIRLRIGAHRISPQKDTQSSFTKSLPQRLILCSLKMKVSTIWKNSLILYNVIFEREGSTKQKIKVWPQFIWMAKMNFGLTLWRQFVFYNHYHIAKWQNTDLCMYMFFLLFWMANLRK